ncbi:ketopantoate reductase family protein [Paraburkholderia sediminicola]|uniref:ketopantoate reductase family protein n=1 Tax=Paraburkholderia sediminicola TaxID=458836 RepID=UPI0038B77537
MKIMVLGAGAVGSYFGAALALGGNDVVFAVRDINRTTIMTDGVQLLGPRGDFCVTNIGVIDSPEKVGTIDVILSCVKLYDAESSARQWKIALESSRAVISLQNGIDGVQRILAGAPDAKVYGGLAFVSGRMERPGLVHYLSDMSSITFGGVNATTDPTVKRFVQTVNKPGNPLQVRASCVDDVRVAQWSKFLALATNAALTCLTRANAGVIYQDPRLLALARQSIHEIHALAIAEGVALTHDHVEAALLFLQRLPSDVVASMSHDLHAGKPLELDGLSGLICSLGRRHEIPTPFHQVAYACLKPYSNGA